MSKKLTRLTKLNTLLFLMAILSALLLGCDNDPPKAVTINADDIFKVNTVEIQATGAFGEVQAGTGVILTSIDGMPLIASNYHVAGEEGALISVRFFDEEEFVNTNTITSDSIIEVVLFDKSNDLCIFKVDYTPKTMYNDLTVLNEAGILPLAAQPEVSVGQSVSCLGNYNGEGIQKLAGNIVALSSELSTEFGVMTLIQTTLPIAKGCSGGALYDEKGQLLGLMSFSSGGYSYAVRSIFILTMLDSL